MSAWVRLVNGGRSRSGGLWYNSCTEYCLCKNASRLCGSKEATFECDQY